MRYNFKGFTFIELIIVMVILAIASSIVYIRVGGSIGSNSDKKFVQEFMGLCQKARRMALTRGLPRAVYLSSEKRKCWIKEGKGLTVPEDMLIEGEDIWRPEEGLFAVYFFPDGSCSGGSLYFTGSSSKKWLLHFDIITGTIGLDRQTEFS